MDFFMSFEPPTVTAQEKKIRIVKGKPIFYEPAALHAARAKMSHYLDLYKPISPMEGPLRLEAYWYFAATKTHKPGTWRTTRPDTDNLEKLLKDCMQAEGFFKNDSQVVSEKVEKMWSETPGIHIILEAI